MFSDFKINYPDLYDLVSAMQAGSVRALAKTITRLENSSKEAEHLLAAMAYYKKKDRAGHVIGITGPPGAGKSSLVSAFTDYIRALGLTVGIAAVDPSSPFTGGAILGDRIRMQKHCSDPGVYIRSMGTRGNLGGLSSATHAVIQALDFFYFDIIIIETVGIGQSEVAVMEVADTVVVVEAPGMGDEIQAIKAGVMEIGHVFVVNKADRPGVERTMLQIKANLDMAVDMSVSDFIPPVLKCVATENKGMDSLYKAVKSHWEYIANNSGSLKKSRARRNFKILDTLLRDRASRLFNEIADKNEIKKISDDLENGKIDSYTASAHIGELIFRIND